MPEIAPAVAGRIARQWTHEIESPVEGRLTATPIRWQEANAFVARHHRHSIPVVGALFAIAAHKDAALVGVIIAGRPVARQLDNGVTIELTRCCTDGTRNAASFLYGLARRAATALGYSRIITYTRATENGASLRAAGFVQTATTKAESWDTPSRRRTDHQPPSVKLRWETVVS